MHRWRRQQLLRWRPQHQKRSRPRAHPLPTHSTPNRYACMLLRQHCRASKDNAGGSPTAANWLLLPQGMPPRPDYYVAAPPGPPMYPAPPVYQPQQAAGSSIPWWVWMGAGFLAANAARMVSGLLRLLMAVGSLSWGGWDRLDSGNFRLVAATPPTRSMLGSCSVRVKHSCQLTLQCVLRTHTKHQPPWLCVVPCRCRSL